MADLEIKIPGFEERYATNSVIQIEMPEQETGSQIFSCTLFSF